MAVDPVQIEGEFTVTMGNGLTVIDAVAVAVHPFASVPVTV